MTTMADEKVTYSLLQGSRNRSLRDPYSAKTCRRGGSSEMY